MVIVRLEARTRSLHFAISVIYLIGKGILELNLAHLFSVTVFPSSEMVVPRGLRNVFLYHCWGESQMGLSGSLQQKQVRGSIDNRDTRTI